MHKVRSKESDEEEEDEDGELGFKEKMMLKKRLNKIKRMRNMGKTSLKDLKIRQ